MMRRQVFSLSLAASLVLSLAAAASAQASPESPRAMQVKQHVREVLAAPEFDALRNRNEGMEAFNRWFHDMLQRLQDWLSGRPRTQMQVPTMGPEILRWLILIGLIVGLAFLLAYILRNVGR